MTMQGRVSSALVRIFHNLPFVNLLASEALLFGVSYFVYVAYNHSWLAKKGPL
jgi:hypothetical protein